MRSKGLCPLPPGTLKRSARHAFRIVNLHTKSILAIQLVRIFSLLFSFGRPLALLGPNLGVQGCSWDDFFPEALRRVPV